MPHSLKPRAAADLRSIYEQGVERFGIAQADRYLAGLDQAFTFLAEHPRAARVRSEIQPPIRAHRYRSHVIVYDLGPDDRVIILRVRHGREDWVSQPL